MIHDHQKDEISQSPLKPKKLKNMNLLNLPHNKCINSIRILILNQDDICPSLIVSNFTKSLTFHPLYKACIK